MSLSTSSSDVIEGLTGAVSQNQLLYIVATVIFSVFLLCTTELP